APVGQHHLGDAQIEVRLVVVSIHYREVQLVAQPQVERQLARHFEIVLGEEKRLPDAIARKVVDDAPGDGSRITEQHAGCSQPRARCAGIARIVAVEAERAAWAVERDLEEVAAETPEIAAEL